MKRARLLSPPQSATTQSFGLARRGAIGRLSNDVLLEIFRQCVDESPRSWPTLVHICRKWRRIVFASQQALRLQLFCVPGTPVLKTLDCWPALPIVMEYGGSLALDPLSPTPEDEANVIAAFKQSHRVRSISLTVTTWLLDKLYVIERPFWELEDLILLSRDCVPLRLPIAASAFLWCPRLRRLHLTRIAFPPLLQLLHFSRDIVDLQLHEALNPWCFSIEALTNALSGLVQLRSLSLHSLHFPSTTNYTSPLPLPDQRVVLPALTHLIFRGLAAFLELLLVGIDAPRLGDIQVTVFDKSTIYLSPLGEFVDRMEMHKSHNQARILATEHAISISLTTQPEAPTCLNLQFFIELLSEQLFAMRLFLHFSAFLLNVEDLRISVARPTSRENSLRSGQWPKLITSFASIKWLHFDANDSSNILRALQKADCRQRRTTALHKLYLPHPGLRHVPLSKAVVSFMTSYWRCGDCIGVEYERYERPYASGHISEPVTVDLEMLCDDNLRNIFRQFLDATPRRWPILTRVCRRWQQVILRSPVGLRLRLYCTHGTPVLKSLDCWPPLPLVMNYGGPPILDTPDPEDEDNIVAALKQSDRVSSINLTITHSLLGKMSMISEPFSELGELVLLSQDRLQLTLPSAFRWGPRIHTLHVTGITIPVLPQLLSSSTDLVDLQLHKISMASYFPPQVFANALSGASRLRSLSHHFLSFPPRRNYLDLPPPGHRIVLPALTRFKYRGVSKYLEIFVASIDAPRLRDIDITFFSQPTLDASQLGQFIERTEMQTPLTEAEMKISPHAISICFQNSATSTRLRLQISCTRLDWQLSSMAQVCDQFSPLLFSVKHLVINSNGFPSGQGDVDGEQWPKLVRPFSGVRTLSIDGKLSTIILCALQQADGGSTTGTVVLPSLRHLLVRKRMPLDSPFWDAAQSLIYSRGFSILSIDSELRVLCHICNTGFTPQKLKEHLVAHHAYEIDCSYCGNFRFTLAYIRRFQEHLRRNHPEIAQDDELIWQDSFTLTPLQVDTLAKRHSSLQNPQIVSPSTIVTAPNFRQLEIQDP